MVVHGNMSTPLKTCLQDSKSFIRTGIMRTEIFLKNNSNPYPLVRETHGSLSQCVSFSLVDVGSVLTAYSFFLFKISPRTSQGHTFFCKAKSHARIAGNENTDKIAKYLASLKDNNLTDTGTPSAGPGANPFYNIALLAREEARPTTPELSYPIPNLIYLSDLKDALKSHMHAKHRLGYVDRKTGYYTIIKACYLMQIMTLAMPYGTCHVSQPV
eukprot:1148912-Pelagomonas_calceolata.AAC.1